MYSQHMQGAPFTIPTQACYIDACVVASLTRHGTRSLEVFGYCSMGALKVQELNRDWAINEYA